MNSEHISLIWLLCESEIDRHFFKKKRTSFEDWWSLTNSPIQVVASKNIILPCISVLISFEAIIYQLSADHFGLDSTNSMDVNIQ